MQYWTTLVWAQLPAELRITSLDEIETDLIANREAKLMVFLEQKVDIPSLLMKSLGLVNKYTVCRLFVIEQDMYIDLCLVVGNL